MENLDNLMQSAAADGRRIGYNLVVDKEIRIRHAIFEVRTFN
jgi:hypothetical protein